MTTQNPFEDYMASMPQDELPIAGEFIPSCDTVHPHIDDALQVLMEDCGKISEDGVEALNKMLGPARLQMINCLTQEFLILFDVKIMEWEDMANQALTSMPDSQLEEEEIADLEESSDPYDEDAPDETPILLPYNQFEDMLSRCLKMAYFIMPEVSEVIHGTP